MNKTLFLPVRLYILIFFLLPNSLVLSQESKPCLSVEDYDSWHSLGQTSISPDGKWIAYSLNYVSGTDTLFIKPTRGDKTYKIPHGNQLAFTEDSKWAACLMGYSEAEREKMQEKKEEIRNKLVLICLADGKKKTIKDIQSFEFARNSIHLAMETYTGEDERKDLIIRNLEQGTHLDLGNVSEWSFNKPGTHLAFLMNTEGNRGNGAHLILLDNYHIHILDSDTVTYRQLSWDKNGSALAFLKSFTDTLFKDESHILYALNDLNKPQSLKVLDQREMQSFPENMKISEHYTPRWSEDLSTVFFGIIDWEPAEKDSVKQGEKKNENIAGVDIWHWKDDPIQPRQEKTYNRDKNFSYLCAWHPETGNTVRLSDEKAREATLTGNQKYAMVWDKTPYQPQFRLEHGNLYLVNVTSGKKTPVLTNFKIQYFAGSSPEGKYLLYFRDHHWWTYDIAEDKHTNLTGSIPVPFWNTRDDGPLVEKPPFGSGGWMKNDQEVILYSEYDTWNFRPDGSNAINLTHGRENEIRYRILRLDREEEWVDPDQPVYFSKFGDKTKKSGFSMLEPGGKLRELLYEDKLYRQLSKAKQEEAYIYTAESYEDSPDIYFTDNLFRKTTPLTRTNPQQSHYSWGKAELIDFTSQNGKPLQGVLHYPANFIPGKQYPMVVYIYEIRSNSLHQYIHPSPRSFYNITHYSQQGYFVFQPDIVYEVNEPGMSAVNCVLPGVKKVLETGMIDENSVGLMGHSWGAYQTTFIITQTDLFSAAVAGAPLTNMISMYNSIYWNTGTPDQQIFETSQGRFRNPYWELMDKYIRNSPLFQAENIETPLLVAFGNEDGAVDWHQGIELYITMRRMQKPMIMLVYAGENHSVRKKENMLDYTAKIHQFFAHYLKNEKAEPWIIEGMKYLDKKKREREHQ